MADSENPTMNTVKAASLHSAQSPAFVNASRVQLRHRNEAVLARGQAGNDGVRVPFGELPTHVGGLVANLPKLPPSSPVFAPRYPNVNA